jgi:hypothetical protein
MTETAARVHDVAPSAEQRGRGAAPPPPPPSAGAAFTPQHRRELVAFLATAESDAGRASWWPELVERAGGAGSSSGDPEARITDPRFHRGPAGRTPIPHARAVRAALVQLPEERQQVLFAAHAPTLGGAR